ncbi:MAG: preprotein translocase subunit YajC [candidate division FCPU426 bacterium]
MNDIWMMAMGNMAPSGSAGSGAAADPAAGFMSLLPLLLIFVLFYVLFIVPQRRQQKKHDELIKTLRKGDEVVTSGGMFGTVAGFNERENTVYLKMGENVKIEIQRQSISGLRKTAAPESKTDVPAPK